jgi:cysteinyl-tRNA synthetase
MSCKYLGEQFDIHGGGMDLLFPHHECEIAQSVATTGKDPVRYWIHNNMITINGQKMGKSLGNFINLDEFFSGNHKLLEQPYSPITIRFFILQAHYRSPLDFSNEGLKAAEKGLRRLLNANRQLKNLKASDRSTSDIPALVKSCYEAMNDDLNTAVTIANLFEGARIINSVNAGSETISVQDLELLKKLMSDFTFDILGLKEEEGNDTAEVDGLINLIIDLRGEAKMKKDFSTSDKIRERLEALGFKIKDGKEGTTWQKE